MKPLIWSINGVRLWMNLKKKMAAIPGKVELF